MKILLRDQKTKLYYAGEKGWKSQPNEAVPFPSSVNAWRLVLADFNGEPVELVYWFENSADNILSDRSTPPAGAVVRPRLIFSASDRCRR